MFNKIVSVDDTGLTPNVIRALEELTKELDLYHDYPADQQTIIDRAHDAEILLVSWNTPISKEILSACPKLKYVGMCCSLYDEESANVDISAARDLGIAVRGVRDYGDEGVAEYITSALIQLFHGYGPYQYDLEPRELSAYQIGIVGFGAVGEMVAKALMAFGMKVAYYSRTQKKAASDLGIPYLPLTDLLRECQVISTHLPRGTQLLQQEHFELMNHKVLVNTGLGPSFSVPAFTTWMQGDNYAIFDGGGLEGVKELASLPRVISRESVAGWTQEAKGRLAEKALKNLIDFTKDNR